MTTLLKTLLIALAIPLVAAQASAQNTPEYRAGTPVSITNSNGNVSVRGVAGAKVQVTATYVSSGIAADVDVQTDGTTFRIQPRRGARGGGEITLDVVLPADARIGLVEAKNGNITVGGFTSDVRVEGHSGNVRVDGVGGASVRCSSGDVAVTGVTGSAFVESASGSVTVTGVRGNLTANCRSGNVTVRDVGGNVESTVLSGNFAIEKMGGSIRVATISGNVLVNGAGGNASVQTASGDVSLIDVAGNVDGTTASGNVEFRGQVRSGLRYHLKSHSGDAVIQMCGDAPGFVVTMQSYSGEMETDFPLTIEGPMTMSKILRGRFGDGSADLEVQAFSGSARVLKCETGTKRRRED
jgi:DUF4097 and DUF4098 domain-containing protein YvlB